MSNYISCNVLKEDILELLPHVASCGEQMCRLASPAHDDVDRYLLPWVWIRLSDLAPLLFPSDGVEATQEVEA